MSGRELQATTVATMTQRVATPTGEKATQLLSGVVIGALVVYVGVFVTKGLTFGVLVAFLGVAFLARNRPRVGLVARGIAISGLVGLAGVLIVLALGHDVV